MVNFWHPNILIVAGLVFGSSTAIQAQPPINESLVKAALMLRVFDQFSAQCQADRGFNSGETASIKQWQTTQNVSAVRAEITTIPTDIQTEVEKGATDVVKSVQQQSPGNPCVLAVRITTVKDAQFAKTLPQLTISKIPAPATPTSTPSPPSTPALVSNSITAALVATIDSFGFITTTGFGVGGWVTQEVVPVVLFRNGEALKDVKGFNYPGGLAAHRQEKPQAWTKWRRSDGWVELASNNVWKKIPFGVTYPALPDNFQLSGSYRSLSGTGNAAIGGSSSVTAWRNYTFSTDGQVLRDAGAGASTGDVVTAGVKPSQRGRYKINGLILRIRYDDASIEERIIITNPQDSKSAIWLDGMGYSKRK
jgi:hypothetical protein